MPEELKIRNFECGYANTVGVSADVTAGLDLAFPDAYKHRDTMATLARAIREHDGAGFCLLPFCRTVEIEAVGANVNYGDANTGPRPAAPICETPEDFLALPSIDFTGGRIHEVLEACRLLVDAGETVCLELVGPWTQMQGLMEARKVVKMNRKQPELMLQVMNKLGCDLLCYVDEARARGVQIIMYSDSAGTLDILSPKIMAQTTREFTHPFMKQLVDRVGDNMVVQLCPKIAYALLDTGCAEERLIELGRPVGFLEAALELRGQAKLLGQTCIMLPGAKIANGKIREIVLK